MNERLKIGDLVLIKAEITRIDYEEEYPYDVSIHCGKDVWVDDYAVSHDAIISRYDNDNIKEKQLVIAESTKKEIIVTADIYRETLNNIQKMLYTDILQMMGWLEYEAPLNRESCIVRIIENYIPKKVVDAYEEYIDKNVLHPNDVVQYNVSKKQYLVTKIFENKVHMIAVDGETTVISSDGIKKDKWKKVKQNVLIQEFFNKEVQV